MVTQLGMSEKLGPRTFGKRQELVFLGKEIHEQQDYSDHIAEEIDEEVKRLIETAHETARRELTNNRAKLEEISKYLIEHESIEDEALEKLFSTPELGEPEPVPADD